MKFLCDSCKAKYQIADEKVAGKTVRMKCRKCGHQIEVRAAVTETSVTSAPPRGPAGPAGLLMGGVPAAPRPPQRAGLATTLSATKPRAPSPSMAPGPLAGAFQRNISEAPGSVPSEAAATIELSVTDEWYVAINGVPVGPVRISELRRKAAAGAVTEESLCWQEGLEEWRPIKSIPDLAAIVREAALGNRASLIGAPPEPGAPRRSPSIPSAPPREPSARSDLRAPRASVPPARPTAPSAPSGTRSNVVPLRPAASSSLDDIGMAPMGGAAAAFAPAFTPERAPSFTPPAPNAISQPLPDPFALPPPAAPLMAPLLSPSLPPPGYAQDKQRVPLWFWPILVLVLGFGVGVAFLVFRPQPPPAPVVIQMPQAATTPASGPERADQPPPTTPGEAPPPSTPETKTKTAVAARGSPRAPVVEEKKGLDLGNLVSGSGGPNVGPNAGPGAAGGGLDQPAVERVVAGHRVGVKRTCWERGGGDQKSSVNVTVTANVAPNGTVASTSSSGDNPVVAKCLENQVKTWQFPAPGTPTTINVPFKFVRQ